MSDFSIYKSLEASRVGASSEIANGYGPVAQEHTHDGRARIANVTAGLTEEAVGRAAFKANVTGIVVTPSAAFVANTTDYNVVNVFKRTGNGAAVTVASANLANVAGTAFVPIALTLVANAANTVVAAGDVLTCNVTKTGNGVANNPVGNLSFVLEDI